MPITGATELNANWNNVGEKAKVRCCAIFSGPRSDRNKLKWKRKAASRQKNIKLNARAMDERALECMLCVSANHRHLGNICQSWCWFPIAHNSSAPPTMDRTTNTPKIRLTIRRGASLELMRTSRSSHSRTMTAKDVNLRWRCWSSRISLWCKFYTKHRSFAQSHCLRELSLTPFASRVVCWHRHRHPMA